MLIFFNDRCFVPESSRWLLAVGRYPEARRGLERTAAVNGVTLAEGVLDSLERTAKQKEGEEEAKLATTADLFRYPQTRARWGI